MEVNSYNWACKRHTTTRIHCTVLYTTVLQKGLVPERMNNDTWHSPMYSRGFCAILFLPRKQEGRLALPTLTNCDSGWMGLHNSLAFQAREWGWGVVCGSGGVLRWYGKATKKRDDFKRIEFAYIWTARWRGWSHMRTTPTFLSCMLNMYAKFSLAWAFHLFGGRVTWSLFGIAQLALARCEGEH